MRKVKMVFLVILSMIFPSFLVFGGSSFCSILSSWPHGVSVLDLVAETNENSFSWGNIWFTNVSYALPNTQYTSNTVFLTGFSDSIDLEVMGGNGTTLLINGVEVGNSTEVWPGDTLSIRTYTLGSTEPETIVTLRISAATCFIRTRNWILTTADIEPLIDIGGTVSGTTYGEFAVNKVGAGTYTIPITISPGTGGLQPDLRLVYNSQGGNGLLGMGMSLSGLSQITRCSTNLDQDGFIDGIDFDENDRFCLDGERLVAVLGDYGANGTEYRTEHEIFSRIISYGGTPSDPGRFTVQTKAGLKMEYGFTVDSRIEAEGRTEASVWALNPGQSHLKLLDNSSAI